MKVELDTAAPAPTPAPSPESQMQDKVSVLVKCCTEAAMAEAQLMQVRSVRGTEPEVIADAASAYRVARAQVDGALADLLAFQVKLFMEAGT